MAENPIRVSGLFTSHPGTIMIFKKQMRSGVDDEQFTMLKNLEQYMWFENRIVPGKNEPDN
jgi:hypothetical protein